jgi:hypothetical protein
MGKQANNLNIYDIKLTNIFMYLSTKSLGIHIKSCIKKWEDE